MITVGTVVLVTGAALFIGSFALASDPKVVVRAWGVATFLLGFFVIALWAIATDHDNLEHGPRLGRLALLAVLTTTALTWAAVRTVASRRARDAQDRNAAA